MGTLARGRFADLGEAALRVAVPSADTIVAAYRTLSRLPWFSGVSVLALSVAIAANSSLYAVLDAVLRPNLGIPSPARLVYASYRARNSSANQSLFVEALTERARSYAGITGFTLRSKQLVANGLNYREVRPAFVPLNYFRVIGVTRAAGRLLSPADTGYSGEIAIISRSLARGLFPSIDQAIGATVLLEGRAVTVLGVIERGLPLASELWILMPASERPSVVLARLKDGVSTSDAATELASVGRVVAAEGGLSPNAVSTSLVPAMEDNLRVQSFHLAAFLGVFVVLVVAALNVAALQLSRGLHRVSEYATRAALGATRGMIAKQVVLETLILALPSLVIGMLLAYWSSEVMRSLIPPNITVAAVEPRWNWSVLGVSAAVTLSVAGLAALLPAIALTGLDAPQVLRGATDRDQSRASVWCSNGLVVVQVGLALTLSVGAVLLTRSALKLGFEGRGVDTRALVTARIWQATSASQPRSAVAAQLVARVRRESRVSEAAAVVLSWAPLNGSFLIDDHRGAVSEVRAPAFNFELVTPSYLRTLSIPVLRGRDFRETGEFEPVGIVNETAARLWWPVSEPVGSLIKLGAANTSAPLVRIIGVSKDVRMDPAQEEVLPQLVFAHSSDSSGQRNELQSFEVLLRSQDPPRTVLQMRLTGGAHRRNWAETWDRLKGIDRLRLQHRFFASLFAALSAFSLGLAALGIYSVFEQRIAHRSREFGIRLALGATELDLILRVVREAAVLGLGGIAVGMFTARWAVGLLRSYLFGLDALDPMLFASVATVVLAVVVLGSIVSSVRLASMDVSRAIRAA